MVAFAVLHSIQLQYMCIQLLKHYSTNVNGDVPPIDFPPYLCSEWYILKTMVASYTKISVSVA